MGATATARPFSDFEAKRDEFVRRYFEPQLARLGLSVEQIEGQDLDQLNESLIRVDDAIANPESFGTLKLRVLADANILLATAQQEAHMEIGILPLLFERKSLMLSRIKKLVGERKIDSLKDLVATVADPQLRTRIESEVSTLAEQSRQLAEQESAVAHAQAEQIAKRDKVLAKLRAELFERRLRAWTGFFAKESMATYVGAFLLIVLTFVQVAAMFAGSAYKSEIVNNAFLLLMGYFFGQSVASRQPSQDSRS
jgi:hypothetical protein